MPTVFITDGQLRSALAVVRSLGDAGLRVVCGESTRVATSFASRHVDETVVYPSPDERPEAFAAFLAGYLREHDVDVLVPVGHEATRVVNRERERLSQSTRVPVAGSERFERAVRKDRVLELARAVDVPRPLTARPADVDEASAFAESVGFPVAIKPVDSSGSRGLRFVESPAAFPGAYRAVREEFGPPLVQEKLPEEGTGMGAGFLFWNGELQAEFAYRRLREYPPSGGPSTLRESIAGRELLEPGRRLLESLDWHGVAMVEFKNDVRTDTPKLMEVNPRFWGSLHLPVYAGVDFPRLLVALALGETVETPDYEPGVRCRYLLPGDLLYVAATRDLAPLTDLASRTGEHFDIVSRTDPGPMAGRVAAMIRYAFDREMWRNVVLRGNN